LQASSIPVINGVIGRIEAMVVYARDLHQFLNVGRDFSTWIKGRILTSQYFQGTDYAIFDSPRVVNQESTTGRGGDRKSIGYLVDPIAVVHHRKHRAHCFRRSLDCG
jgi:anti-repressor protein